MVKYWQIFTAMLLSAVLLPVSVQAEKQTYYRWVDASGNTSYGSIPPANVDAVKVNIHTGRVVPTPAVKQPQSKAEKTLPRMEIELERGEAERLCGLAQTNLTTLKGAGIIRLRYEDGESVVLDEDAKQRQIDDAEQAIARYCEK